MKSLAAGLLLFLSAGATPDETDRVESLRFNPRERTGSGISALENGDLETAVEHLETAHRLDNGSPITAFNAGTARLLAGDENAADRLEEAAAAAPESLQPAALYNLGNAKLAAQDPAAAVDAYKQVLRLDQSHMEAKFNLEVAQRMVDEQQQDQQQQQDKSSEQEEQQQQQDDQQQSQEPEQDPSEEPEDQDGSGQEEEEQQPEPQTEPEQEREQPLPGFENQEDMTAEQAAAILEAVENLEREQRRQQAEERARRRSKSGKDW